MSRWGHGVLLGFEPRSRIAGLVRDTYLNFSRCCHMSSGYNNLLFYWKVGSRFSMFLVSSGLIFANQVPEMVSYCSNFYFPGVM